MSLPPRRPFYDTDALNRNGLECCWLCIPPTYGWPELRCVFSRPSASTTSPTSEQSSTCRQPTSATGKPTTEPEGHTESDSSAGYSDFTGETAACGACKGTGSGEGAASRTSKGIDEQAMRVLEWQETLPPTLSFALRILPLLSTRSKPRILTTSYEELSIP